MRMPVKSERDAFRIACGSALLIVAAVVLGALVAPWVGVVALAAGVAVALALDVRAKDPDRRLPLREAAGQAGRAADGRRRVLVVANETLRGEELREELGARGTDAIVRVVAPVLPSRSHYVASDIDRELAEARVRLADTLAWARDAGLAATGRVSDSAPLTAIEDELRSFPADELLISTHPPRRSRWLESRLVERAREQLEIPVSHVVVDLARREAGVR